MMNCTIDRWESKPGGYDVLHTQLYQPPLTQQGYPMMIREVGLPIPDALVQFRYPTQKPYDAIHFYTDDYRFECVWNRPTVYAKRLYGKLIISPDFSVYADWPILVQQWNHYRAMYIAAFLQSNCIRVIPSVSWSNESSYAWCFNGIPEGFEMVSISAVGADKYANEFSRGVDAMISAIHPGRILCLGEFWDVYTGSARPDVTEYPYLFGRRRHERRDL